MKSNSIYIIFIFIIFELVSCQKYDVQFEGAYDEVNGPPSEAKVVAFVINGNVFMTNARLQDLVEIDDSGDVEVVSINNAHTKIIFKRENQNIQIYDIISQSIEGEVPNSQDAEWYDFHANNETIYFQTDWIVSTYGPEVIPNNTVDIKNILSDYASGFILRGVAISREGDIIYSVQRDNNSHSLHYYDGQNKYDTEVYVGSYRRHLRLDEAEVALWTSNLAQTNISIHSLPNLELTGGANGFSFAGPVNDLQGFLVVENFNNTGKEAILLPGTTLALSLPIGLKILSIDY